MDLAEIRKKANRDRDDAARAESHRQFTGGDSAAADDTVSEDAVRSESFIEEEPDWSFEPETATDAADDLDETATGSPVAEEPEPAASPVEPGPAEPVESPVISIPAFPASAAMEFSAAMSGGAVADSSFEGDIEEIPVQRTGETIDHGFDPLAILMAGRAASGYGDDLVIVSDEMAEAESADYHEFLCFRICNEQYAVNIMEIKEIIKPREITEVPRVPDFISGVLSLRGIIIPVFNMRKRLHLESSEPGARERILVVSKGEELFGIQVDEVLQMVRIPEGGIELPPAVLEGIDRDFVLGIGRHDGDMLILLNLGSILDVSLF